MAALFCAVPGWAQEAAVDEEIVCLTIGIRENVERYRDLHRSPVTGDFCTDWQTFRTLPQVEVYADRLPGGPGSLTVFGPGDVADVLADHPAEILNRAPGVNVQMNSGQEHLISLRSPVLTGGAGQGSFLIMENGIPTRASAFGNVNGLFEPHHEVAAGVEVVRGPGSAKYGSNAVHGLFNFFLPTTAGDGLDLRVSGSTLERYRLDTVLRVPDEALLALSLQDDRGWRDATGVRQYKGTALADVTFAGWRGEAWISASSLEQETAGFIQGFKSYRDRDIAETNPNPEAYRNAWSVRAAARFVRDFDLGTVTFSPYARLQEMEFRQHFLPYRGIEENGHASAGVFASVATDFGAWNVRYGGQVEWADGFLIETQLQPFGFFPGDTRFPVGVHYDYQVETLLAAGWGEVDWQVSNQISVLAGLRVETIHYDYETDAPVGINGRFNVPADRTDQYTLVTPKLGVVWREAVPGWDVFANYARGQRAPQASDLYRLQSLQTVGEIDTETLDSLEIGVRGSVRDRLSLEAVAYVMEKENFFFRDRDGLNVVDGQTDHLGVEVSGILFVTEAVTLAGQVSWSDQTYGFDRVANGIVPGNRIDTAPEWLADLEVIWTPLAELEVGLGAEFIGEYFVDETATRTYSGHTVLTARGNYQVGEGLEVFGIVRNLADVAYADRADFAFGNSRYFPGEPINLTVGLRARY